MQEARDAKIATKSMRANYNSGAQSRSITCRKIFSGGTTRLEWNVMERIKEGMDLLVQGT